MKGVQELMIQKKSNMFISELERFLDSTEETITVLKNNITEAKRLLSLSSELDDENEEEASNQEVVQEEMHSEVTGIDSSLEEDINRILKMAEKVRIRAKADENIKSATRHSVHISKTIPTKGGKALATSSAKKIEVGQRSITSAAAPTTGRVKTSVNSLKTTYRQDFRLNRVQQTVTTRKDSREIEKKPSHHEPEKTNNLPEKSAKLLKPELKDKKVLDKRKELPTQFYKNKSAGAKGSSAVPFRVSEFLGEENSRKLTLLEAITKKIEIPKYKELFEGIKCYHSFQEKAGDEFHEEENKLKQNFLKKCVALDETSEGSQSKLESIFKKLLPFSGWAVGIENCPDMNLLKKIMLEEKHNLEKIMHTYQGDRVKIDDVFSSAFSSDTPNLREYGIWNPSAILPISEGLEGLDYLQFENVKEQLSFQKDLHELQEYQLQIKICQHVSRIISHHFSNEESGNVLKNEDCTRFLLKSLATIADFSGHLRMPILACNENNSATSGP